MRAIRSGTPVAVDRVNAINAALRYWAPRYPRLRIVDWKLGAVGPGREEPLLPLNPDANEKGQAVMAELIADAIATC